MLATSPAFKDNAQRALADPGLQKALGMGRGKIFAIFSLESVLIGFWGAMLGVLGWRLVGMWRDGRDAVSLMCTMAIVASLLTWLFDTPLMPSAFTRSSTERVDTPWMQAS